MQPPPKPNRPRAEIIDVTPDTPVREARRYDNPSPAHLPPPPPLPGKFARTMPAPSDVVAELETPAPAAEARPRARGRAASRPDDDGSTSPFVTYRLDKLDDVVAKLVDADSRVGSKVDGLAVKVDDLALKFTRREDGETSRKAFWSFMTVAVTVLGTMFANYLSKPPPVSQTPTTVHTEFDRKLEALCSNIPDLETRLKCGAQIGAEAADKTKPNH